MNGQDEERRIGLYKKYNVEKVYGDTDSDAQYFVFRLDTDEDARLAVLFYAYLIRKENQELADDLRELIYLLRGEVSAGGGQNEL